MALIEGEIKIQAKNQTAARKQLTAALEKDWKKNIKPQLANIISKMDFKARKVTVDYKYQNSIEIENLGAK